MYWDIVFVRPEDHFTLTVKFIDGLEGKVRFKLSHLKGVFAVLKDSAYFNKVYINHGVVTWPGGLDIAPDAMYIEIKKHGEWVLE